MEKFLSKEENKNLIPIIFSHAWLSRKTRNLIKGNIYKGGV